MKTPDLIETKLWKLVLVWLLCIFVTAYVVVRTLDAARLAYLGCRDRGGTVERCLLGAHDGGAAS